MAKEFQIAKTPLDFNKQEFKAPFFPPILNNPRVILSGFGLGFLKTLVIGDLFEESDKPVGTSVFGTPVFSNITFGTANKKINPEAADGYSISYSEDDGIPADAATNTPATLPTLVTLPGITLQSILMEVTTKKNIVTTSLQGMKGTVKEYISDGDYEINIKGALASKEANKFPERELLLLKAICNVPAQIEVTSRFLDLFDIQALVITEASYYQKEGTNNMILFEIKAISDLPIELAKQQ